MIRVLNLRTGSVVAIPGSKTLLAPRISPDGRWIAALSLQVDKLLLFDMQKQTWRELAKADRIEWPHWSHDGRYIYFERADFKAADSGFEVARVGVKGGLPEVMLQLKSYRTTGVDPAWFDPDATGRHRGSARHRRRHGDLCACVGCSLRTPRSSPG